MDSLWSCIEPGRTTAIVGLALPPPPPDVGWKVLRVAADGPTQHLGPVLEARRRIDESVGKHSSFREMLSERLRSGVRRRLLGEADAVDRAWPLVEPLNRLASAFDGAVAVVFDGVQAADTATIELLEEVVTHPGRLGLALVLVFAIEPTEGPAVSLLAAVKRVEGPRGVLGASAGPDTLAELRPVARFSTDEDVPAVITQDAPGVPAESAIEDTPSANEPGFGPLDPRARMVLRAAALVGAEFTVGRVADLLERKPERVLEALQLAMDAGYPVRDLGRGRCSIPQPLVEGLVRELMPSLAAAWSERLAALTTPATSDRLVDAADEAASMGAWPEAVAYARRGLERLSEGPVHRLARCRLRLQIGSLLWHAAAARGQQTLSEALEELAAAEALLTEQDPALLRAAIHQAVGGVLYDMEDPESLGRALEEFRAAIGVLSEEHDPLEVAALLNDQAAVHVRLGAPDQATQLLRQSREIFDTLERTDEVKLELAETEHLLARLPLHALDPREQDPASLEEALAHARSALRLYGSTGERRNQAHVQETAGRLLTRLGRLDEATDLLTRAFTTQDGLGDALGMARSTAALSELKLAQSDLDGALSYLAESVRLNVAKGTRRGLGLNRSALAMIQERVPQQDSLRLAPMLQAVTRELAGAGLTEQR